MAAKQQRRGSENRSLRLNFRLTPNEREAIEARAQAAGMDVSAFLRVSALTAEMWSKFDPEALDPMAETAQAIVSLGGSLRLWLDGEDQGETDPANLLAEMERKLAELRETLDRTALTMRE